LRIFRSDDDRKKILTLPPLPHFGGELFFLPLLLRLRRFARSLNLSYVRHLFAELLKSRQALPKSGLVIPSDVIAYAKYLACEQPPTGFIIDGV
jgi:hypothetical protein